MKPILQIFLKSIVSLTFYALSINILTSNALAADLRHLTDSVMNGWRKDFQEEMNTLIRSANCKASVDLTNLTDSVMNGWRKDFQDQMIALARCTGCISSFDLNNLTDSVMNGWRRDFEVQMGSLIQCSKR
jgi:hypothetical protein